jgi:hypothetical protein
MKIKHDDDFIYNGLCAGCDASCKEIDIDPEKYLSKQWLCGRCRIDLERAQIEELPVYLKYRWNKLLHELSNALENIEGQKRVSALYMKVLLDHGINPQAIRDDGTIIKKEKPMFVNSEFVNSESAQLGEGDV